MGKMKTDGSNKEIKRSFAFPQRLWDMLQECAHRTGLSGSAIIRGVLKEYAHKYRNKGPVRDVLPDESAHRTSVMWDEELDTVINEVAASVHATPTTLVRTVLFENLTKYRKRGELDDVIVVEATEELQAGLREAARVWGMDVSSVVQMLLRDHLPDFIARGEERVERLKGDRRANR